MVTLAACCEAQGLDGGPPTAAVVAAAAARALSIGGWEKTDWYVPVWLEGGGNHIDRSSTWKGER